MDIIRRSRSSQVQPVNTLRLTGDPAGVPESAEVRYVSMMRYLGLAPFPAAPSDAVAVDSEDLENHGDDLVHHYCPRCNPPEALEPGALITRLCGSRGLAGVGHDGNGSPYGPQCASCMAVRTSGLGCPACGYLPPSGS